MTPRRLGLGTVSFSVALATFSCVGDNPYGSPADTGTTADGGPDAEEQRPGVSSGGSSSGGAGLPDASTCSEPTSCVNGKLVACGETVVDCGTVGCVEASATNATRCKLFTPTAPAKTSDLTNEIVTATLEIGATTTIDVTSGAITVGATTVRRPTNGATWNEDHGIGFEIRQVNSGRNAAVIVVRDLVLSGTPAFAGSVSQSQALVLVAQRTVRVLGNVAFPCGTVVGGEATQAGDSAGHAGPQSFVFWPLYPGGGGAGGNFVGGAGGTLSGTQLSVDGQAQSTVNAPGGAGGVLATTDALRGGSGGGVGIPTDSGGTGGAAVLIVAGNSVAIGAATGSAGAGLDTSGCGGAVGAGGGAGGWLGVEAPLITAFANAGLAANGGSGGGNVAGARGNFSTVVAPGAPAGQIGAGGNGGTDIAPTGAPQTAPPQSSPGFGGGGGGAAGRIVVRTATGALTIDTTGATPWFASPTPTLLGLVAEGD